MESLFRDFRFALRSIQKNRGFAIVVGLTLALGIGANTAIFSFVNAILLRPAPFRDMERLVRIESIRGSESGRLSMLEIRDIREQVPAVESIAAYRSGAQYNASGGGKPEEIPSTLNTRNLFDVLGVPFHLGGTWPQEYDLERNFGIILSYELWKRRFGGDPNVVGSKITLDAAPFYTIFGVLSPGIRFPGDAVMFRSICINDRSPNYTDRSARSSFAVARLKPQVTLEQAEAQLKILSTDLSRKYPDTNSGLQLTMTPLREFYVGNIRPYLMLLLGVVGFVLLIACANVVNLLLTRALARGKDIAIRSSLGAGRWELMRYILAETILLSMLGGAFGLLFAVWGVGAIGRIIQIELPPWMTVSMDRPVLFFTLGVSIFTGILSGLVPALQATRPNLNELLKEGTRGSSFGSRRHIFRRVLVATEIALALILLIGAGLMVRTFLQLQNTELGFNPQQILTFRIALPWRTYETLDKTEPFTRQLLERLSVLPGVEGAEVTSNLPLSGEAEEGKITFTLEGQSWDQQQKNPYINDISISPGYFRLMQIPLLQGRLFEESDQVNSMRVGIVSRRFAERIWPGQNPLGKRLKVGSPDSQAQWTTIIGIVGNVKHENVTGDEGLDLYVSYRQVNTENVYVLLKSRMNPARLGEEATKAVWRIDADQSTFDVQTMEQRIAEILWQRRISGMLVILFAALAIVLAGIGIYGVMSYSVRQRTREIGIRIALGAKGTDVQKMVLREVLTLAVIGGAVGLPGAFVLSWFMSSLFYKVSPLDLPTYVGVPILLLLVAVAAGFLPAYRASRVDPIDALRSE